MYTPIFAMTPCRVTWLPVFSGMVAGLVVLLVWKAFHWNAMMYEIVPGFIANILTILIVDRFAGLKNPETEREFETMVAEIKAFRTE